MSSKREERRQRAEVHRLEQEQLRQQRRWRSRALAVSVVLALLAMGFFSLRRDDGEQREGRVWSAAHGHWHDK